MGVGFRGQVWKRVWKMTFFGLKWGQDLENGAAHPHQEFRRRPPGDLGPDIRTPSTLLPYSKITSASSYKDVSMVTSECVIEPSEKGTQTSAIKSPKEG